RSINPTECVRCLTNGAYNNYRSRVGLLTGRSQGFLSTSRMARELSSCRQANQVADLSHSMKTIRKSSILPFQNNILSSLSREAYSRFSPHLKAVSLAAGEVLSEPGLIAEQAYFINSGMVSVLAVLRDGDSLEVGIIGNEGLADINM